MKGRRDDLASISPRLDGAGKARRGRGEAGGRRERRYNRDRRLRSQLPSRQTRPSPGLPHSFPLPPVRLSTRLRASPRRTAAFRVPPPAALPLSASQPVRPRRAPSRLPPTRRETGFGNRRPLWDSLGFFSRGEKQQQQQQRRRRRLPRGRGGDGGEEKTLTISRRFSTPPAEVSAGVIGSAHPGSKPSGFSGAMRGRRVLGFRAPLGRPSGLAVPLPE